MLDGGPGEAVPVADVQHPACVVIGFRRRRHDAPLSRAASAPLRSIAGEPSAMSIAASAVRAADTD
jgi:hypothetical protein